MKEAPTYLRNFERVVEAYGYWPSFHDSPVLRFDHDDDSIEIDLEAWDMTTETNEEGFYDLIKKHHIEFRFSEIISADVDNFPGDNILFELKFSPSAAQEPDGYFTVCLESAMGGNLCGQFNAKYGEVVQVIPINDPNETKTEQKH